MSNVLSRVIAGLFGLGLICLATPAVAQIVNVQSILATEAAEGWSGSAAGSADWRTGNTELIILSGTAAIRHRHGRHLLLAVASGDFARTNDKRITSKTFEHLRYRYQLHPVFIAEVFGQHVFDEFRRLELRTLGGAGVNTLLWRGDGLGLSLGTAYMIEYERLNEGDESDAGETVVNHRLSTYLMATYELDDRLQLIETLYAQPRIRRADDIRVSNDVSLVIRLTTRLSLRVSLLLAYDSQPPEDIEALDTSLKFAVTYAF